MSAPAMAASRGDWSSFKKPGSLFGSLLSLSAICVILWLGGIVNESTTHYLRGVGSTSMRAAVNNKGGRCPPRSSCAMYQWNDTTRGFLHGDWVHRPDRDRSELIYMPQAYFADSEREFRQTHPYPNQSLPWNSYDWVSEDDCCALHTFNKDKMCQIFKQLGVKTLLIVGDSISYQFTSSLNGLMRGTTDVEGWRDDPGGVWRADVCGPEEKDLRMMYLRNDELYTGSEKLVHSFPWTHLLKNESVDMLVLNNGAHQHSMEQYKPLVDEVVDYLKVHFKGRVVFRTTAPGHPNCWLQDAPRNSSYDYDNFLGPESQGYTWWHPLLEFNYYAAPRFSELERSFILNVEPLAKQRVDGHMQGPWNDCLHYHLPGPPDWWIVLFYNMLELAAIQENGGLLPVEDREPVVEIKA